MTADVSAGRLYAEVVSDTSGFARNLRAKINAEVKDLRAKIKVELDERGLITQARAAAKTASQAAVVKLKVELDTRGVIGQARAAAAVASQAAVVKLKVEVDTSGVVAQARAAAAEASAGGVSVNVGADTTPAKAEIEKLKEETKRIPPVEVPVKVDDKNLKKAGTALMQLGKAPAIAGGIFLLGSAIVQAGGGLVAMASSASQAIGVVGAIPNLLGVVAQGAAAVLIGINGVGDALTAMGKAEAASQVASASSGATAQATARAVEGARRARVQAARAVGDAERSLADAQKNADDTATRGARAVSDARRSLADAREQATAREQSSIDNVAGAEWSLARAQEYALDAQKALTQARVDAQQRIRDLNAALKSSALDEEAAMLAVEQARKNLQDANWNPMTSTLQKKQADLAYRQAIDNLDNIRVRNGDLAKETAKANKQGVEGSSQVEQARDSVRDTLHAEQEAQKNLAKAQQDAAKSQRDSARQIADAQQNLTDTIKSNADAAVAAARQVSDAHRSVADAQQNLADAQLALAQANKTAAEGGTLAQKAAAAAEAALKRLSPAGQAFAKFLFGLKPRWLDLRNTIQQALLPPIQAGITAAMPLLDTFQTGLVDTATRVGAITQRLGGILGAKTFNTDVATIMASNNRALSDFGDAGLNLILILKDLAVAAGPLVERFAAWVSTVTRGWQETIKAARASGDLATFFQKSGDMAAQLGTILGNIGKALFNIGKAAAPTGQQLLDTFTKVTAKWAEWTGSDTGQQRMQKFFEATKPATEELGKLVANLVEFITKAGEGGGGSLTGFLGTLNAILGALNAILGIPGVAPVFGALMTVAGVGGALSFVAGAVLKIGGNIEKVGKVTGLSKLIKHFRDSRKAAKEADDAADGVGKTLRGRFSSAVSASGKAVADAAKAVGGWVASLAKAAWQTAVLTARVIANRVAIIASAIASGIVRVATVAWSIAQAALNFIMNLNPIFLIVTLIGLLIAAIVVAYRNHEGFRLLVQKVWAAIQTAVLWAWTNVLKPTLEALWTALKTVGGWAMWLWNNAIKIAFDLIAKGLSLYWNYYLKPILTAFWMALQFLGRVATWLWQNAIAPALSGIWAALKFAWEKGIKPLWDAFTGAIKWGWEKIISPAFAALKKGVGGLGTAFGAAVTAIGKAWDAIQGVVRAPIKAVLELVNTWLIDKFNWVSGKLGGPTIPRINTSGFDAGAPKAKPKSTTTTAGGGHEPANPHGLADGGPVPGPRRGARADNVMIRATPDEFMVRRWAADKLRKAMPGALEYINQHGTLPGYAVGGFIRRGMQALAGYANGGFIRPVAAPWAGVWGHYASGGSHPALDFPVPIGTQVGAVMDGVVNAVRDLTGSYGKHIRISHANGVESIYGHLSDAIVNIGDKVAAGQKIGLSGNSGNSTGPHLHLELRRNGSPFDFTDMLRSGKAPGGGNAITNLLGGIAGKVSGVIGEPLKWLQDQINGPVNKLKDQFGNSTLAQMVTAMPQKLVGTAADKVKSLLGLASEASTPTSTGASGNESNRGIVRSAAAARGWTGQQWAALDWLVSHESGFNNTAQNPTSTAYGLFQFLDSTWGPYGSKTSDPNLQTKYGLEYIAQRYGTPANARSFWLGHNWYDNGGWMMPGTGIHHNATGKPEAVLTNPQWTAVDSILGRLAQISPSLRAVDSTGKTAAALVDHLEVSVQDVRDLPDALSEVDFRLRKILQGGVHASRTAGAPA